MLHKNLEDKNWFKLDIYQQMANIGAEVGRALKWQRKNKEYSQMAFYRALELLFLTIDDKKNKKHLKELTRIYEILVDYFYGENLLKTDREFLERYFNCFNFALANKNG